MIRKSLLTKSLMLAALAATVTMLPASVRAQADEDVYRENTDIQKIFHKLGRGIVNVLTGWVEIPKNIAHEWRETEPFTGTIIGLIKGIGWTFARTFAGVYEIISFPFPVPRDYQPLMRPEFVLPSVWGDRLPIYQDEFKAGTATKAPAMDYSTGKPTDTRRSY